jgi:hypothetical protein
MPVIVERLGAGRALAWFAANMPRYEKTLKELGPIRTHILATEISILGACEYCTHGHGLAFELHYFEQHGRLFPLDEAELVALHRAEPEVAIARIDEALESAGLVAEIELLRRMRALRDGAAVDGTTDRRIAHLITMFATLNACGVARQVRPDEVHDPINKKRALKQRYDEARASTTTLRGVASG